MAKFIHQMVFNVVSRGDGSAKGVRAVCTAMRSDLDIIFNSII